MPVVIEMIENDGAVDQHLAVGKPQGRHPGDRVEGGQFRLVRAKRHQRHVAIVDAVQPQRHRHPPHKGRGVATVQHRRGGHRRGLILGHDVPNFLRYAPLNNKAKMSGEDKRA